MQSPVRCRHPPFSEFKPLNLDKKGKGSTYSITQRRVPELILVLCSQVT